MDRRCWFYFYMNVVITVYFRCWFYFFLCSLSSLMDPLDFGAVLRLQTPAEFFS